MGKIKKLRGRFRGRSSKLYSAKDITECCVCGKKNRNDKIKNHQANLVLFNKNGTVANSKHPFYKGLSGNEKLHTDYFFSVRATSSNYPRNKFIKSVRKPSLDQMTLEEMMARSKNSLRRESLEDNDSEREDDPSDDVTEESINGSELNNNHEEQVDESKEL